MSAPFLPALVLASLLGGASSVLHAQATTDPYDEVPVVVDSGPQRAFWIPIGVTLGWRGEGPTRNSLVVGGEISLISITPGSGMFQGPKDPSLVFGVFADAVWVSNPSHFRAGVGAEILWAFDGVYAAGVEAGVTFHSRGDPVGFRARALFTLLFPTFYVGLDYHGGVGAEVGVLLKVPVRP